MEFNEIERKVKEAAEVVVEKAESVAKTVGEKATKLVEEGRLKAKVNEISSAVNKKLLSLGKLAYENREELGSSEEAALLVEEIDMCYRDIEKLKNEIAKVKGQVYCHNCGKYNSPDSKYCNYCGEILEEDPLMLID